MENEIEQSSYKAYYLVGIIIVIAIIGYLFLFTGTSELIDQKCIDLFSKYDSAISGASLNYIDDIAEYDTDNSFSLFTLSDSGVYCKMTYRGQKIVNGQLDKCDDFEFYSYAKEHENFYETEFTVGSLTVVELYSKTSGTLVSFENIKDKKFCGE